MSSARSAGAAARWSALAACVIAGAGTAAAQSILQFDRWMQRIDRRSQSVQRYIMARDAPAAVADAREIGELYKLVEAYFVQRGHSGNAVRISRDAQALAAAVTKSLEASDFELASRSAISIARACRDCHFEYKPLDP